MPSRVRLFGFAFANADFLFEIERTGTVLFATGAQREIAGGKPLDGTPARDLFEAREGARFLGLARGLAEGGRCGPLRMKLAGGREVDVAMCRLPQNGERISCTLAYPGVRNGTPAKRQDASTGLPDRDTFLAEVGEKDTGQLALLDIAALAQLPSGDANTVLSCIGKAIAQAGLTTTGRISETRFGAIAQGGVQLVEVVRRALAEGGLGKIAIEQTLISLKSGGLSREQRMLALRYAMDQVSLRTADAPADLGAAFERIVQETETRAARMMDMVSDGQFRLAYQPIVEIASGAVAHFEALSRFENANTQEMIQFAEQLGISDAFDIAVAIKVLAIVESLAGRSPSVALNISGNTLSTPSSFGLLAGLLARRRALAPKILIEVTETAAISDLSDANKAIQSLRGMGYRVGLDDFGAGAASFQYLHAFTVDFVKVDGALVKNIGKSPREDLLLKSIISLCQQLHVETIAEHVGNPAILSSVKAMGFTLGQGHHFGKALPELPPMLEKHRARRSGVQEQWG